MPPIKELFQITLPVRGYEIDVYGHVNNAVYLQWLEQARWEWSRANQIGIEFENVLSVVRHLDLDFKHEVLFGDEVEISLWPRICKNTSVIVGAQIKIIKSDIQKNINQVALNAQMVLALVEKGSKQKAPVPSKWRSFFPEHDPGETLSD
jgi:YbgC/YbaW family acyl-CoA thioester hydrolase